MKTISEKKYTARELASQFGCTAKTVHNHANKLFGKEKNGVERKFTDAQVTVLLESIKSSIAKGRPVGDSKDLEKVLLGMETEQTEALRLAVLYKEVASIERRMKERALLRAVKAEAELGRLTVEHKDVLQANAQLWRIAESAGAIISDREDMLALYRR